MAAGEKNCLPDPGLVWGPWKCLPEKLLIHVPTGMAVVADLHLGYRGGDGDTLDDSLNKVMAPLLRAWRREKPRGLVIAGDLVDQPGKKLFAAIHHWFISNQLEVVGLVPGNRDGSALASGLPLFPDGFGLGPYRVRHAFEPGIPMLLHAHEHPMVHLPAPTPCFLLGDNRIILPAYHDRLAGRNILRRRDRADLDKLNCVALVDGELQMLGAVSGLASVDARKSGLKTQCCPGGNSPGENGIGREGPRNLPGRASYSDAVSSGSCPGSHQKRKRQ